MVRDASASASTTPTFLSARVLVVEDDPEARGALEEVLAAAGHEVRSVGDGRAAIDVMTTWRPDIVVLDLMLPVMDGWQVLAAKRQDPSLADIPVIVVSGNATAMAAAAHAELYIVKPLDARTVLQSIADILGSRELRRHPEQVARSERMAALGTLAAGIAHEINNPLTFVVLQLERAAGIARQVTDAALAEQLEASLRRALDGAFRIRDIAHDVSAFCRAEPAKSGLVDLREAVRIATRLVRHMIERRARLRVHEGSAPLVMAGEGRIVQVLVNLLVNAVQALPDEGEHEIRATLGTDPEGWATVEISDTGAGIPKHLIGRIFEPFFTTKRERDGTGLGLSVSHGIITAIGGQLTVSSEPGRGATFRIRLPPARAVRPSRPPSALEKASAGSRRRILVIDDEPHLLSAVAEALAGDDVVMAASGRAGLEILLRDDHFDVILCDIHMAAMGGMDLLASVRDRRPGLESKFLFMTGGALTEASGSFLDSTHHEVLSKPFTAQALRERIQQVCDTSGRAPT